MMVWSVTSPGCSSEMREVTGQVRSWDDRYMGDPAECTTLAEAETTVTLDGFNATDVDMQRLGTVATFGAFELQNWRRWYSTALTNKEGKECKALSFSVLEAATPRKQSLRLTASGVAEVKVEIRTDFPVLGEAAELAFDASYDSATQSYLPTDGGVFCQQDTSNMSSAVWYITTSPADSGARLIPAGEGWLAVVPFRSSQGCAVVEYYSPAGP